MPEVGLWELCCRWPAPVLPALVPYIPPCVEDLRRGVVHQLLGDPVSGLGVHGKKLGWRAQLRLGILGSCLYSTKYSLQKPRQKIYFLHLKIIAHLEFKICLTKKYYFDLTTTKKIRVSGDFLQKK